MSASDSWRRARGRLGTALAWSSGRDDDPDGGWNVEGYDGEGYARDGRDARDARDREPSLQLVRAARQKICVIAVATYDDAQRVADAFRADTPVMVDLQGCGTEVARRMTDFCSGLTYARDGRLAAIAENVILLVPAHAELSGDERRGLAGGGFYNQA
jgi:SepF-like predicted cell division protein (DUF552 family)